MPDQYAHYYFACRVWQALDERYRGRVNVYSAAFRAGSFGPDPLFNEPDARRRQEGFGMHRRSGREAMERMRMPVKRGMPYAAEYAAGFFCHYALDRICHPEILRRAQKGDAPHVAMEAAYDQSLIRREGGLLPRRIILTDAMCLAAAQMYHTVTPQGFRASVNRYWKLRRMLCAGAGTLAAEAVGRMMPEWKGVIPLKRDTQALTDAKAAIDAMLTEGIAPAAAQLERWFYAVDHDLAADEWLDADFSGNLP